MPDESDEQVLGYVRTCFPEADVELLHNGSVLNTPEADAHVQRLRELIVASGAGSGAFRDEHFGSDARFYSEAGIPAVCFGPAGAGLHSHEEWVDIASLEQFYTIIGELARAY